MRRLIILARFTKITLPKIYSKPKQKTYWRDSPKAHHGKSADHSRASFHGSRQITAIGRLQHSFISRNSADHSIASFHGKSVDHSIASFHGKLADHSIASFHGKSADHSTASFHGSRQITAWGHFHSGFISQGRAKSQGRRAFHRVAPNHRVAYFTAYHHFTESLQITAWGHFHSSLLLHTHFTHPTQSSLFSFFGFNFFCKLPNFLFFERLNFGVKQTNKQTNISRPLVR